MTVTDSMDQIPMESGPAIVIPDQDVKAKGAKGAKKGKGSMLQDIEKAHHKVSRAHLHLFDDRVFLAEDKEEAQKLLSLNKSKNPIRRKMNPLLGGVMKIFEIQLSLVRAVFNVCMWKDSMLSFWFTVLVFCLMVVLFIFPWRLFFFIVGLVGLGPQNYFLINKYHARRTSRPKATPVVVDPERERRTSVAAEDSTDSPLLLRDNIRMKADGKRREVIVPGEDCVFRFNRFYDWPADPTTTTIEKEL